MIENIIGGAAWLENPVPLWAFLIALLTSPSKWAGYVQEAIESRIGEQAQN